MTTVIITADAIYADRKVTWKDWFGNVMGFSEAHKIFWGDDVIYSFAGNLQVASDFMEDPSLFDLKKTWKWFDLNYGGFYKSETYIVRITKKSIRIYSVITRCFWGYAVSHRIDLIYDTPLERHREDKQNYFILGSGREYAAASFEKHGNAIQAIYDASKLDERTGMDADWFPFDYLK